MRRSRMEATANVLHFDPLAVRVVRRYWALFEGRRYTLEQRRDVEYQHPRTEGLVRVDDEDEDAELEAGDGHGRRQRNG